MTSAALRPSDPPSDDAALCAFIKNEATALLLANVQGQHAAWRTSQVILLSACAYVSVTAFGYAQAEHSRQAELPSASSALDARSSELQRAQHDEQRLFERERTAASRFEMLIAPIPGLDKAAAIAEKRAARDLEASLRASSGKQQLEAARLKSARDDLDDALVAESKARADIAAFKQREMDRRQPWDRRRDDVPAELDQVLVRARSSVAEYTGVWLSAQSAARAASEPPPREHGSKEEQKVDDDLVRAHGDAEAAKMELIHARDELDVSRRTLETAKIARAAAQSNFDRATGVPVPLQLPVLGIAVNPAIFFTMAPILLVFLYLSAVITDFMLARTSRVLTDRADARSIPRSELVRYVPPLQWQPLRFWLSHPVVVLPLLSLAWFNPERIASTIALSLMLVGWGAWGAIATARPRRARVPRPEPTPVDRRSAATQQVALVSADATKTKGMS